jgi:hypothetical protein
MVFKYLTLNTLLIKSSNFPKVKKTFGKLNDKVFIIIFEITFLFKSLHLNQGIPSQNRQYIIYIMLQTIRYIFLNTKALQSFYV